MRDVVFLDTECTGLDRNADIWEFGAVRRHVDGSRSRLHMFVEHDPVKAVRLPEPFHTDYTRRCPVNRDDLVPQRTAAIEIYEFIGGDPIVVGAVVTFDSHRLAVLFGRHRIPQPRWLYTVVDVCALAAGYLRARGEPVEFPVRLDQLGQHLGIDTSKHARHTALGDAAFVEDIFDRCNVGGPTQTPNVA
ncbi:MAG: exonuclease domain-containing protein [Mycolicibacterium sp.]|uniref:exonuclease domain-containing protein n=1 Tax=Mycolicibacterium sp. TaxID=2320850 RepID=UPI003D09852B